MQKKKIIIEMFLTENLLHCLICAAFKQYCPDSSVGRAED